jgi:hypothetical protein
MTKKCLEILDFEDKETQAGKKYVRFKTNEGWMSCFDNKEFEELKKLKGSSVNVDIAEKGEFKNIKKILEGETIKKETPLKETSKISAGFPLSMKVSYAKDVFCAMCTRISQSAFDEMTEEERLELMDLAIKAIYKAEEAFKS